MSGLSCGTLDLHCSMWDLFLRRAGFSLVVERGLSSCGMWAPERVGSVVCSTRALSLRHTTSSVVVVHGLLIVVASLVVEHRL